MMKQGLLLLIVHFLVLGNGFPVYGQKNLVLHQAYDYWPAPNYGDTNDAADAVQLTDGESHASESMWTQRSAVGWAGVDIPVVIRFDLGQAATVKELRFHTVSGIEAGVVEVGLRVFLSEDDKTYVLAGQRPAKPPKAQSGRYSVQLRVPLNARARYVAVVAEAPNPYPFVFVDEIEVLGQTPAHPKSVLQKRGSIVTASGAKGLQELLAAGLRSTKLLADLTGPLKQHLACWPKELADAQRNELKALHRRVLADPASYDTLRAELTTNHRDRARQVYATDTLAWEVAPDEAFTMLSLPPRVEPPTAATIHTVVNALEATALGVANLTNGALPLTIKVAGGGVGAPQITVRVGWFFVTSHARYIPDALLANDAPQTIPSGESRLVWLEAESSGATPGVYDYDVTVRVGERIHQIPLRVHVHDVRLDRQTSLVSGNWSDLNTGELPIHAQVRAAMLSHRCTLGEGTSGAYPFPSKDSQGNVVRPVQLDFTTLDKFLEFHQDFAQVNLFIPFDHHSDRPHSDWFGPAEWMSDEFKDIFGQWLRQIVERIKASGRDYDTFSLTAFDETLDEKVEQVCRLIHAVDPKVRVAITIPQASKEATRGLVDAGMNIFIYHAPRLEYDNGPDGFGVLSSGGREFRIYAAADSDFGTGKEQDPLGWYRYLYWAAFRHGATGVNFWNLLNNNGGSPVWAEEPVTTNYWPMLYPIGPGYPTPPAEVVPTAETVIPSRRWEYTRMGAEDYMLLKMAQDKITAMGAAGAPYQRQLDRIVQAVITNRNADRQLFRSKRLELVELVEQLP